MDDEGAQCAVSILHGSLTSPADSPAASSDNENDVDETMEDAEEEVNGDADGDLDNDEEIEDNEDDDEQDDALDNADESPVRMAAPLHHGNGVVDSKDLSINGNSNENSQLDGSNDPRSRPAHQEHSVGTDGAPSTPPPYVKPKLSPYRPPVREDAMRATVYDIVPTIAAPHSTSINCVTSTPDMRWVFSGGSDGWIRKFNWVDTANSKSMLTVAQRHPFVDSVTKAGVLMSYWENEETSGMPLSSQE